MYKDRFSQSGQRIFDEALREARSRGQNHISLGHIFYAIAHQGIDLFVAIIMRLGVDLQELRGFIEKEIENAPRYSGKGIHLAPEVNEMLKRSLERARVKGRDRIRAMDLIVALSQDENGLFIKALTAFNANSENVIAIINFLISKFEEKETRSSLDLLETDDQQKGKPSYQVGETVRIKSGAFASFTGKVKEVNQEKSTLKIKVTVFNRPKEMEFKFSDVERLVFADSA